MADDKTVGKGSDTVILPAKDLAAIYAVLWCTTHRARLGPGATRELNRVLTDILKPLFTSEYLHRLELVLHRGEADDGFDAVRKLGETEVLD